MKKYKDLRLNNKKILFNKIIEESVRQCEKHGIESVPAFQWMSYLTEEVGELAQAINDNYFCKQSKKNVIEESIQVATLALKIAEMFIYTK